MSLVQRERQGLSGGRGCAGAHEGQRPHQNAARRWDCASVIDENWVQRRPPIADFMGTQTSVFLYKKSITRGENIERANFDSTIAENLLTTMWI